VQVFIRDDGKPQGGKPVDANSTDLPQNEGDFQKQTSECDNPIARPYNPVDSGDYVVRDVTR
jgi:hypothetical protein